MAGRRNENVKDAVGIPEDFSDPDDIIEHSFESSDEMDISESDESLQRMESSDNEEENQEKSGVSRKRIISESESEERVERMESSDNEEENRERSGASRKRIISESESDSETIVTDSSTNESDTEIGGDGTTWTKLKVGDSGEPNPFENMFKDIGGPTAYAKKHVEEGKVSSAFNLIITKDMIQDIKKCAEKEARRVLKKDWTISTSKLLSFIGILYARGAYGASTLNANYLWSKEWGPPFFSKTMPRDEFMQILRFMGFEKKTKRSSKFGTTSEMWNDFIRNSQRCYEPHANISIGEQVGLVKARNEFPKSKNRKCFMKFWLAVDTPSKYILNGIANLDKTGTSTPSAEFVVMELAKPYLKKGRNITTSHVFTGLTLAEKLSESGTSLVGIVAASKMELPKFARVRNDKMRLYSSRHYKAEKCLLTVYKRKTNQKIMLLSTKHTSVTTKDRIRIPSTVEYYKNTRFPLKEMEEMSRKYTTKSGSFPGSLFFKILDLAAINACILYTECTGLKMTHRSFLFQLAKELAEGGKKVSVVPPPSKPPLGERRYCEIAFCNKNRSSHTCRVCEKFVCGKCANRVEYLCPRCAAPSED